MGDTITNVFRTKCVVEWYHGEAKQKVDNILNDPLFSILCEYPHQSEIEVFNFVNDGDELQIDQSRSNQLSASEYFVVGFVLIDVI